MTEPLYKILHPDGSPCHGGSGKWGLPNGKPGKWMPEIQDVVPCERGYHLCRPADLPTWVRYGTHLFRVETRGELLAEDDKVVAASARLTARVEAWTDDLLRTWAMECALRAVRVTMPPALRAAKIDEALVLACEEAETLPAARAAAGDAAWAGWAAGDAAEAARAAAEAARAAAGDAAWAARAAAGAAAEAARAAAEAAGAAAGDAAWAGWAAERRWQSDRLVELLGLSTNTALEDTLVADDLAWRIGVAVADWYGRNDEYRENFISQVAAIAFQELAPLLSAVDAVLEVYAEAWRATGGGSPPGRMTNVIDALRAARGAGP